MKIKFKARAKVNNKHSNIKAGDWVYGCYIESGCDAPCIIFGDGEQIEVDKKSLGQFTGKCDQNGNEIYSGDIIQFDYIVPEEMPTGIGAVYYCENNACYRVKDNLGDKDPLVDMDGFIIGNVSENPEYVEVIDKLLKFYPKQCA